MSGGGGGGGGGHGATILKGIPAPRKKCANE